MTRTMQPYVDPGADAWLARTPAPRRALFLDRDGVVNVDRNYVHTPDQVEWIPGIFELCRMAGAASFLPIVVTNQAGIGRGYYSDADFLDFTRWVHACFAERGAPLFATFYCPHHPDAGLGEYRVACPCRKPAPGMLRAANAAFDLDAARSGLVGDKAGDIEAGRAAGIGILVQVRSDKRDTGPVRGALVESLEEVWAIIARGGKPDAA